MQVGSGEQQGLVGSEIGGEFKASGVDVGDEDAGAAGGASGLEQQKANHAGADDQSGFATLNLGDANSVEGDGDGFEHGGFGKREGRG